jgi:glycosyltransferase involved in cell wall biosynthesis
MIDPQKPDFSKTPVSPKRPCFGYTPINSSQHPYVTIVTPFYNTGSVFHETARSVLAQSFQQWEWLIVNDASNAPDALAVLDAYRSSDQRIRIIDLPANSGPAAARNVGFRDARTAFVAQVDSDDLLEPTAIEKWLWLLESYPEYSFVKGYSVGFGAQEYLWPKGFPTERILLQENQIDLNCLIRKSVHQAVGGYDESIRTGLEDWDFWLHCASAGYWGATITEYLNWYRRRPDHDQRWATWDQGQREKQFRAQLQQRYPNLWREGIPNIQPRPHQSYDPVPDELPFQNRLARARPRLLLIVPWLALGGADKFNLDVVRELVERHGYEVTIAATLDGHHTWQPLFADVTPDVFILNSFLRLVDYPRFLKYLIQSRQITTVLISSSELGYLLLPYLRAACPAAVMIDYLHMEVDEWKNGGYPRASLNQASQLDLTIVSSAHLKQWMVERGADTARIDICTTNIDPDYWSPERFDRAALRTQLGIAIDLPVILFSGRITAQKQPLLLGNVMRQLKQRGMQFVTLVAGDGEDRPALEVFLRRHNLTEVRLLGSIGLERVRELLALSDIFFLPSQHEGISLAMYEAMAMGVVPVGADVGGQQELVTPECGVLVRRSADEATDYVAALEHLLRDPTRRAAMGLAARKRIHECFRLDHMGQQMIDLIGRARALSEQAPQHVVPRNLGLAIATQAIEQTRLEITANQLWAQMQSHSIYQPGPNVTQLSLARRAALRLKHMLRPIYRLALRNGMGGWLVPLRQRVATKMARWVH